MKIKRAIALLLLASLLVGCGSTVNETKDTGTSDTETTAGDTTTEEATGRKFDKPDIEPKDYEGREFNILYASDGAYRAHELYFFSDGENGDTLNDAVYKRNIAVEDKLNIKINGVTNGYIDTIYPSIQKSVMAGTPDYDLALTHTFYGVPSLITEQLVCDWNKVEGVDLSKNYWNQNMNDTLAINGVLPVAKSEYMPPEVFLILFNKKLQNEYQLEDYYQVVRDGKWTHDYFVQEASKISEDLNGDGVYDVNDKYGFSSMIDANFQAFFTGCDFYSVSKTDDGLVVTQPTEKFVNMYDKLYTLVYGGHSSYTFTYEDAGTPKELNFENDQSLFYLGSTDSIDLLRSMNTDFGILPFPKYNEQQDNYRSLSMSGYITIPVCAGDQELSGIASEYLAYESAEILTPVFYDMLLGSKYIRDDESSEMLDIIFENIVFDPAMVYGMNNAISYSAAFLLKGKTTNVASYFEKNTKSIQATYDKIYEAFLEYEN